MEDADFAIINSKEILKTINSVKMKRKKDVANNEIKVLGGSLNGKKIGDFLNLNSHFTDVPPNAFFMRSQTLVQILFPQSHKWRSQIFWP